MVRPIAISVLWCGLCLCGAAVGQSSPNDRLPDGPGKAEFIHNCLDCHSAGMVLRARKTPEEWRKSVDEMASRGSDGSKEDIDKVVLYLDKYFAVDKSTPPAPPPSVTLCNCLPSLRAALAHPYVKPVAGGSPVRLASLDGLLRHLSSLPLQPDHL